MRGRSHRRRLTLTARIRLAQVVGDRSNRGVQLFCVLLALSRQPLYFSLENRDTTRDATPEHYQLERAHKLCPHYLLGKANKWPPVARFDLLGGPINWRRLRPRQRLE